MFESLLTVLTVAAAAASGLVAGVFFAFSSFVMGALTSLGTTRGIAAMQSINVVVLRSWFIVTFLATTVLAAVLAVVSLVRWNAPGSIALLAGSALYLVGVFGVTILFNVPLNNALAEVDAGSVSGSDMWNRYNVAWTRWNHLRTVAALAATVAFIMAMAGS
jgi:uncharacterized membrane protein